MTGGILPSNSSAERNAATAEEQAVLYREPFLSVDTPESYQKSNAGSRTPDRMIRRLRLAENVCRELRFQLTARVVDQDWSRILPMLHKWMRCAPEDVRYSRPPAPNRK